MPVPVYKYFLIHNNGENISVEDPNLFWIHI
jgi:hypothetical protein